MSSLAANLLNGDFMPHGHCLLWRPGLLAMHVIPDLLTTLAYYAIPFALVVIVHKRRDLAFNWLFVMFSVFIFACGTTHLAEVINIWHGYYYAEGMVKIATALVSVATAAALWPLIPRILTIPSSAALAEKNAELDAARRELEKVNAELEQRVEARTAELQATNRELDDFVYAASHDLKEPLRGICNFALFLKEDHGRELPEEGRKKLDTVISLSRRLDALISSLLEYSRLGRTTPDFKSNDLGELLTNALEALKFPLEECNARVVTATPLPTVPCDAVGIQQVLFNLLSNAIKYNDKAEPVVEIGALDKASLPAGAAPPQEPGGKDVIVYVKDNGIGIGKEHFENIFRMFKRLHARSRYEGTGIGLAMVRKIIDRHGGRIWLQSGPGRGTTFYFSLPGEQS